MFHTMPEDMRARMRHLEAIDDRDRTDGTPHLQRMRQVPPETGRFLALLAVAAPEGEFLEIGTSAGYSALWISLACVARDQRLVTFELLPDKVALARETFRVASAEEWIELVEGDARDHLSRYDGIAFCFLDAEKEIYEACYEAVVSRLVPGGFLLADNAVSHRDVLGPFLARAEADPRVDALVVPIGRGVLLCRRT